MGGAESYRAQGSGPGIDGLDKLYPGGPFDPLEFASDPDTLAELKVGPYVPPPGANILCAGSDRSDSSVEAFACPLRCLSEQQTCHL